MPRPAHIHPRRALALVAALCFTGVVLALGIAVITMSVHEQVSAKRQSETIVARNVAEAGVDAALYMLQQAPAWRCTGSPVGYTSQPVTATVNGRTVTLGTYTVQPIEDRSDGTIKIRATGTSLGIAGGPARTKTIGVVAYPAGSAGLFAAGMFGKTRIQINGNVSTDSYDSTIGPYASQIPGYKGSIRTNASSFSAITLNGNSTVHGNVIYGPGTALTGRYNGNVTVEDNDGNPNNNIQAAPRTMDLPAVNAPANAQPLGLAVGMGNTKTVNWNGKSNITIPAGVWEADNFNINGNSDVYTVGDVTLICNGSINFNGNTDIFINGKLTIYAKQSFNMNGNVNNNTMNGMSTQQPRNFVIYGTPSCGVVHLNGNAGLNGCIYAPNANVTFNGNAGAYGSVVGDSVDLNGNVQFHYDTSLGGGSGSSSGGFKVATWEEDG